MLVALIRTDHPHIRETRAHEHSRQPALHRRATNGCAREADGTRDRSASPTTRRPRSATSSSSSCRQSGASSPRARRARVVESVKAASDVYAPVAGEVVAVNDDAGERARAGERGRVRARGCSGCKPADAGAVDELLDAAAYEKVDADAE